MRTHDDKMLLCGHELNLVREERELQVGRRSATVEHEFLRCPECGEEVFLPEQMDRVQRLASDKIREMEGLLKPEEIRRIRTRYALSQDAFERLLSVGPKTVVRWEKGTVYQNRSTDTLLRILDEFPEVAAFLAKRNGVALHQAISKLALPGGWSRCEASALEQMDLHSHVSILRTVSHPMIWATTDAPSAEVFDIDIHPGGLNRFVCEQEAVSPFVPVNTVNRIRQTIGI